MSDFENNLPAIIKQLESCEFECQAGPLELNQAFIELKAMSLQKLDMTADQIKEYLDKSIRHWRRQMGNQKALYYVDAFQSVRMSIFNEMLPLIPNDVAGPCICKRYIGDNADCPVHIPHTMGADFAHFMAYSGYSNQPAEIIQMLYKSFEAAWSPTPRRQSFEVIEYDGKFYKVMDDTEHAAFVWGIENTDKGV